MGQGGPGMQQGGGQMRPMMPMPPMRQQGQGPAQ
jgi:hypothetical protein